MKLWNLPKHRPTSSSPSNNRNQEVPWQVTCVWQFTYRGITGKNLTDVKAAPSLEFCAIVTAWRGTVGGSFHRDSHNWRALSVEGGVFVKLYRAHPLKVLQVTPTMSHRQGRNEGGQGSQLPEGRAPKKSQQCRKYFLHMQYICFRKASGSNIGGAKLASYVYIGMRFHLYIFFTIVCVCLIS